MVSSALAGALLAGGAPSPSLLLVLGAAVGCACAAGALLHASQLRERAIAALPIGRGPLAFALLGAALTVLAARAIAVEKPAAIGAGLMLVASVLAADLWLRGRRARPLAIGVGRALVYLTAAGAVTARAPGELWAAAAAAGCYAGGAALAVEKKHRTAARHASGIVLLTVPLAYGPLLVRDAGGAILYGLLLAWVLFTSVDAAVRRRSSLSRYLAGASLFDALALDGHGAPPLAVAAALTCAAAVALGQRR